MWVTPLALRSLLVQIPPVYKSTILCWSQRANERTPALEPHMEFQGSPSPLKSVLLAARYLARQAAALQPLAEVDCVSSRFGKSKDITYKDITYKVKVRHNLLCVLKANRQNLQSTALPWDKGIQKSGMAMSHPLRKEHCPWDNPNDSNTWDVAPGSLHASACLFPGVDSFSSLCNHPSFQKQDPLSRSGFGWAFRKIRMPRLRMGKLPLNVSGCGETKPKLREAVAGAPHQAPGAKCLSDSPLNFRFPINDTQHGYFVYYVYYVFLYAWVVFLELLPVRGVLKENQKDNHCLSFCEG